MINIYADNFDNILLHKKLNQICESVYKVSSFSYLVTYEGTPKELYDNLSDILNGRNVFVCEVYNQYARYWGYMDKSLWAWLAENSKV